MGYEFTDDQNKIVSKLALYMKLTAILTVILGIIDVLYNALEQTWFGIFLSVSVIALGIVFYFPTDNLQRIVTTQGSDIEELMQAFSDLNKGWTVLIIILLITAVISILSTIF